MPTILLIDGLNIVRRVYEAVPGDESPEKVQGALESSWSSIQRALDEHKPTHFLAAFDAAGPNWRHSTFPEYKANRSPMPAMLRAALPGFMQRLNSASLPTLEVPGVEADDIIATLAAKAVGRGFATIVLSTDKDLCQLVALGVTVHDHFKRECRDEAWIQNKFGVPAKLVGDLLSLWGDVSDNIPGVPGVGVKTAAKLLNEHGGFEGVFRAAAGISGKLGENLRTYETQARLSRALVDLKMDVNLGLSPNQLLIAAAESPAVEPRRLRM